MHPRSLTPADKAGLSINDTADLKVTLKGDTVTLEIL